MIVSDEFVEIPDYIKKLIESGEAIDEIRIDGEGDWFHNGVKFENQRIINFFNRSIRKTAEGGYALHYDNFTYPIVVDDAPFFVTGVRFSGFGDFETVHITLKSGVEEMLDIDTLYFRSNNCLYCRVHGGTMKAKFLRSPSFHILDRLEETEDTYYLTLCGRKIVLQEKVD